MESKIKANQTEMREFPKNWVNSKVEDVIIHKKGFAFKSDWFIDVGKRVVKVSDFTSDSVDSNACFFMDEEKAEDFKEVEIQREDIIIATVGSWPSNPASIVGKVIKAPDFVEGALLNQNAVILRVRDGQYVNQLFLYYRLKALDFSEYLVSSAQGSANQASITLKDIFSFEFSLPPLSEQKTIAKILSDLDTKIEINKQVNNTLEAMGQAVFKRWFVDFEFPNEEGKPYKSSGGAMVNNELLGKGIPRGWTVRELGDFIRFIKGKKPTLVSDSQEEGFLPQILIDALDGMQQSFAQTEDMVVTKETDTLMVMDGASSGRVERGHKGVLGSTLAVIDVKEIRSAYVYHFLKGREEDINQNTTGTSIPHADKNRVEKYLVVVPDNERITNQFETISNSILSKSINNKWEIHTLQQIRDYLLPKLMSGKIRVPVPKENMEAQ